MQDVAEDETLWDAFLDQLTLDEMTMLVINGGYETHGVERLGIPHTMDNDGPSSVKGRNGLVYTDSGTAYPCATAIGCTWNVDLAYEMGKGAGKDLCIMKMETKAFKNPEITYDSSLIGSLDTFDDREFEFPYVFTFIRFVFNNFLNVIIYAFRFIL